MSYTVLVRCHYIAIDTKLHHYSNQLQRYHEVYYTTFKKQQILRPCMSEDVIGVTDVPVCQQYDTSDIYGITMKTLQGQTRHTIDTAMIVIQRQIVQ